MRTVAIYLTIGIIVIVAVAFSISTYWHRRTPVGDGVSFVPLGTIQQFGDTQKHTGERSVPADVREYVNEQYGFSFLYPKYLEVREYPGPEDSMTVVLQNTEKPAGFQIFILPHSGKTVSAERFRSDVPSGVQRDMHSVTLANASGVVFYSQDISLGETYEVWIIHGGYLFEITTLAPLDEWLHAILNTWQFF